MSGENRIKNSVMRCDLQDYIEIACLFQYEVQLKLKNGRLMTGTALTTRLNSTNEESVVISTQEGEAESEVPLTSLTEMIVLTENARFERVCFG